MRKLFSLFRKKTREKRIELWVDDSSMSFSSVFSSVFVVSLVELLVCLRALLTQLMKIAHLMRIPPMCFQDFINNFPSSSISILDTIRHIKYQKNIKVPFDWSRQKNAKEQVEKSEKENERWFIIMQRRELLSNF